MDYEASSRVTNPQEIEHLLEQYKTYISDLGNIGARHAQTNTWYVSILSALLVFVSLTSGVGALGDLKAPLQAAIALLAIVICRMWQGHAKSFGVLYLAKFSVIREMEVLLPFPCYKRELELLEKYNYFYFTRIERRIAVALILPFVFVLAIVVVQTIAVWSW